MTSFYNFSLRLYQLYSIFFGFSYFYINFKNRIVKCFKFLKVYVYVLNLLYAALIIYYLDDLLDDDLIEIANNNKVTYFIFIILNINRILILIALTVLRIKEENAVKKYHKTFQAYVEELAVMPANNFTQKIQIFYIFLAISHGIFTVSKLAFYVIENEIYKILETCSNNISTAINLYIMFHHSFILSCIDGCFSKLNNQLKYEGLHETFPSIYFKHSSLLEQVNITNGILIFFVLLSQVLEISINFFLIIQYIGVIHLLRILESLTICMLFLTSINMYLYFQICDLIHTTTKETVELIMEFSGRKQYLEVSFKLA